MQTAIIKQIEYYMSGENLPLPAILALWQEHCNFHEEELRYDHAWKEAKIFMDKTNFVVTDTFIIVESAKVPVLLAPIIARMLNLIHKGTKLITTPSHTLYEPVFNELSKRRTQSLLQSEYIAAKERQFTTVQQLGYLLMLMWFTVTGRKPYEDPTSRMYRYISTKAMTQEKVKIIEIDDIEIMEPPTAPYKKAQANNTPLQLTFQ